MTNVENKTDIFKGIHEIANYLIDMTEEWSKVALDTIGVNFNIDFNGIREKVNDIINKVEENPLDIIATVLETILGIVTTKFITIAIKIKIPFFKGFIPFITPMWLKITSLIYAHSTEFFNVINSSIQSIQNLLNSLIISVKSHWFVIKDKIMTFARDELELLKSTINHGIISADIFIRNAVETIKDFGKNAIASIGKFFKNLGVSLTFTAFTVKVFLKLAFNSALLAAKKWIITVSFNMIIKWRVIWAGKPLLIKCLLVAKEGIVIAIKTIVGILAKALATLINAAFGTSVTANALVPVVGAILVAFGLVIAACIANRIFNFKNKLGSQSYLGGKNIDDSSKIPTAARGGFFNHGQTFIAREAGPELVGKIGRHNAVVNNNQIVEAVSNGVYGAFMSAMFDKKSNSQSTVRVYLDGKLLTMANAV